MSIFFWIKPSDVKRCENLGFTIRKGRGQDRWFYETTDNPFDPTAEMHCIPDDAIVYVSFRQPAPCRMPLGLYKTNKAEMLILEHHEKVRDNQGFFSAEKTVVSKTLRKVSIYAHTLKDLWHIFFEAEKGNIKPSEAPSVDEISRFEKQCG
jgi:hypothetical protein